MSKFQGFANSFRSVQFAKFLFVGGFAALLHWFARFFLEFYVSFSFAVGMAYGVGMLVAFILNAVLVFPASNRPRRNQIQDFIIINLSFFPVVWLFTILIKRFLENFSIIPWPGGISHALAIMIPTLVTFLLYKYLAFREDL